MRALAMMAMLVFAMAGPAGGESFDFSIPEAETRPYEIGARLEARYLYHRHDTDAGRYRLDAATADPGADSNEWRGAIEPTASFRKGIFKAALVTHHEWTEYERDTGTADDVYEGYVSLTPSPSFTVDLGKRSILWGKGYAWNPVGFINREKDPDDAALNLEGRTLAGVDLIRSFEGGSLTNVGLTALLLPVINDWANPEMGEDGDVCYALKLYLLWYDTDIDLIWFDGPCQPLGLGVDFSRNLAENLEIHGEAAWRKDMTRTFVDSRGNPAVERVDVLDLLLGMRYLNALDTTFIAEYYHNGAGADRTEMEDFFAFQAAAVDRWEATGDGTGLRRTGQVVQSFFSRRNPGRDYAYLKVSQKEPFDILYFTPWVAATANLQDLSFNLQPGLTWTPLTDVEINLRVAIPVGPAQTEFGEKPDAFRPEVWVRYFF